MLEPLKLLLLLLFAGAHTLAAPLLYGYLFYFIFHFFFFTYSFVLLLCFAAFMLQLLFQRANTHILEPLTALAMDLLINNVSYTVVAEDMRKDIRS